MLELVSPGLPENWEQECHQGFHTPAATVPQGFHTLTATVPQVLNGTGPSYFALAGMNCLHIYSKLSSKLIIEIWGLFQPSLVH